MLSIVWHDASMEELLQDYKGYRVVYCATYAEKKRFVDEWLSVPGHCTFSFNHNLPDGCQLIICNDWIATLKEDACRKDPSFNNWYRVLDVAPASVDDLI